MTTNSIKAPTALNLNVVEITDVASDEQLLPPGKNTVIVVCDIDYYIIFGQPGSVGDPAGDPALPGAAVVPEKYESSSGATAFRVAAGSGDAGTLTWILG